MPASFKVYPAIGLVHARFCGRMDMEEFVTSARDYSQHPDFSPHHRMLIDLTGLLNDPADVLGMMTTIARVSDYLPTRSDNHLVVYVAPDPPSQLIAQFVMRSLSAMPEMVVRTVQTLDHAMDVLGIARQHPDYLRLMTPQH